MSASEQRPRFFLDRSLGRIAAPERLRAAGWDIVTFAEHYGAGGLERVADSEWISEVAGLGWAILMKDRRMRHRRAVADMVIRCGGRCFVIARAGLTSEQMVERFLGNDRAIFEAVGRPEPCVYVVQSDRLDQLYPARD